VRKNQNRDVEQQGGRTSEIRFLNEISGEKGGNLSRRWCSVYLKIMVINSVLTHLTLIELLKELGRKRHRFPTKDRT